MWTWLVSVYISKILALLLFFFAFLLVFSIIEHSKLLIIFLIPMSNTQIFVMMRVWLNGHCAWQKLSSWTSGSKHFNPILYQMLAICPIYRYRGARILAQCTQTLSNFWLLRYFGHFPACLYYVLCVLSSLFPWQNCFAGWTSCFAESAKYLWAFSQVEKAFQVGHVCLLAPL